MLAGPSSVPEIEQSACSGRIAADVVELRFLCGSRNWMILAPLKEAPSISNRK